MKFRTKSIESKAFKGFGKPPKPKKFDFPLLAGLNKRIRSGELQPGKSSAWDWFESLTEEEWGLLKELGEEKGTEEAILLSLLLLGMEHGKTEIELSEDEIVSCTRRFIAMAAFKELIDTGLVETEDIPKRLSDADRRFHVSVLRPEGF